MRIGRLVGGCFALLHDSEVLHLVTFPQRVLTTVASVVDAYTCPNDELLFASNFFSINQTLLVVADLYFGIAP